MTIEDARERFAAIFLPHPNVTGVGIGAKGDTPVIIVYLLEPGPSLMGLLPHTFLGFTVISHVTGPIVAT